MSILGNRVLRKEDPKLLTVGGTYVDDVRDPLLEGAAHVTFVRSTMAHARIPSVNVDDARQAPGVVAVLTAADVDVGPLPPPIPMLNREMARPLLADGVVRFVGEPLAVVVTDERYQGEDAAELVWADYEPLPAVVDMEEAATDEVVLHEAAGTNTALLLEFGRDDDLFAGCDVVVSETLRNQRLAAVPLEVRSTAAAWGDDGRLTVWTSTQAAQAARDLLQQVLGLDEGAVRVIAPDVGGGFGPKIGIHAEDVLVAWLARHLGRPVRWVETRTENMLAMGQGRGQVQHITIGGRRDGTVEAYRLDIVGDAGAYPELGAFLPYLTRVMAPGVYVIPKVECNARSVTTTTTPTRAYRGAGRPEATAAIERAIDLFAAECGLDPVEVRRRNLVAADAFPHTTAVGTTYDIGDYERALDLVLDAAGYDDLRAEQARRREAGDVRQVGIGVSIYVEVTAGPTAGHEDAKVEMRPDGRAVVHTGTSPHGQGHDTSWAMIAGEQLGISVDDIDVVHGDTDLVPVGVGTFGSRSLQLGGSAVHEAAGQVVDLARRVAAELLEASPDDVVLDRDGGRFHVAGVPAVSRTWAEVATAAAEGVTPAGRDGDGDGDSGSAEGTDGLVAEARFEAGSPTYPFGAHLAVVEVDTETGKVTVERIVTADDAGRILNPLLVEGQRHGGIAQGVAQALCEEVVYDSDGNPQTTNLADYTVISSCELPSFELVTMETPTPLNPLGAKGIGESGTIGATPAVQSAVVDALSHLGVRHLDMPATPRRVWEAIRAAEGAGGGAS